VRRPSQAVNEGLELCRDGGLYVVLGQYADAGRISFNPHVITRKQLRLVGSWGFEPRHVSRALSLLDGTHLKELFSAEITHRYSLEQANEALDAVRSWRAGKAVLTP
jgi:threonine dehydrogenase-like Zn-dependent dehydrogenase